MNSVAQEFGVSQSDPKAPITQKPQQGSSTIHILSLLLRLRQCCSHLSLLKKVDTQTHKPSPLWLNDIDHFSASGLHRSTDSGRHGAGRWRGGSFPGRTAQRSVSLHGDPFVLRPRVRGHSVPQREPLPLLPVWGPQQEHKGVFCPPLGRSKACSEFRKISLKGHLRGKYKHII